MPKESVIESISLNEGKMELFEAAVNNLIQVKYLDDKYFKTVKKEENKPSV